MTLQTHRPQSGWTGDVRQARTKTYTGIRLRRWHTSLAQGTRPCATIWYASSPSRSAQNQPLRNASKQAKLHTDLDHAIATCFTRIGHVRFPHEEARPATRLGAPAWDAHRKQREAHHTHPITRCINDERSGEAKGRLQAQETRPLFKGLGKGEGGGNPDHRTTDQQVCSPGARGRHLSLDRAVKVTNWPHSLFSWGGTQWHRCLHVKTPV